MHRLLIKYLENTCTPQELDQVLAYLKTNAGQQHLAKLLDEEPRHLVQRDDSEADYHRVFDRVDERIRQKGRLSAKKRFSLDRKWFPAAAVVALLLLASAGWLVLQNTGAATYQTAYGETKTVALPDGSVVTLNAHSRLTLADDFAAQREVWLEGEAFFEIKKVHDNARRAIKFVVHTDRLRVEVLGTSFNVQNRDEKTQVVLTSGKVKLTSAAHEAITMKPGELAEVPKNSTLIRKKIVEPKLYSAWTENQLHCNDTPLEEIATVIEHRFGKRVVFQQQGLRKIAVTGTMPLRKLSLLVEVLQESLPITIQADQETLIIREKTPATP